MQRRNLSALGIVLVVLLGAAFECKPPQSNSGSSQPASSGGTRTVAGTVNMENYNKLQTGMSYSQVATILGKQGEELSSSDVAGIKTVMYKWDGDEGGFGANMNAMFQNGKLIMKSQFGLK
jgi:hypothetical protein